MSATRQESLWDKRNEKKPWMSGIDVEVATKTLIGSIRPTPIVSVNAAVMLGTDGQPSNQNKNKNQNQNSDSVEIRSVEDTLVTAQKNAFEGFGRVFLPINTGAHFTALMIREGQVIYIDPFGTNKKEDLPQYVQDIAKELKTEVKFSKTRLQKDGYFCGFWTSLFHYMAAKHPDGTDVNVIINATNDFVGKNDPVRKAQVQKLITILSMQKEDFAGLNKKEFEKYIEGMPLELLQIIQNKINKMLVDTKLEFSQAQKLGLKASQDILDRSIRVKEQSIHTEPPMQPAQHEPPKKEAIPPKGNLHDPLDVDDEVPLKRKTAAKKVKTEEEKEPTLSILEPSKPETTKPATLERFKSLLHPDNQKKLKEFLKGYEGIEYKENRNDSGHPTSLVVKVEGKDKFTVNPRNITTESKEKEDLLLMLQVYRELYPDKLPKITTDLDPAIWKPMLAEVGYTPEQVENIRVMPHAPPPPPAAKLNATHEPQPELEESELTATPAKKP